MRASRALAPPSGVAGASPRRAATLRRASRVARRASRRGVVAPRASSRDDGDASPVGVVVAEDDPDPEPRRAPTPSRDALATPPAPVAPPRDDDDDDADAPAPPPPTNVAARVVATASALAVAFAVGTIDPASSPLPPPALAPPRPRAPAARLLESRAAAAHHGLPRGRHVRRLLRGAHARGARGADVQPGQLEEQLPGALRRGRDVRGRPRARARQRRGSDEDLPREPVRLLAAVPHRRGGDVRRGHVRRAVGPRHGPRHGRVERHARRQRPQVSPGKNQKPRGGGDADAEEGRARGRTTGGGGRRR